MIFRHLSIFEAVCYFCLVVGMPLLLLSFLFAWLNAALVCAIFVTLAGVCLSIDDCFEEER